MGDKDCRVEEQSVQDVNEKLWEIFEINPDIIRMEEVESQTHTVNLETFSAVDWAKVRCLYIHTIQYWAQNYAPSLLSHDGTWLIIYEEQIRKELNNILRRCGKNLLYLNYTMKSPVLLDFSPVLRLQFLSIDNRCNKRVHIRGLEKLTSLETLRLTGAFGFSVLKVVHMKRLQELTIQKNNFLVAVKGLQCLTKLKKLAFWQVNNVWELEFSGLKQLEHISLGNMQSLEKIPVLNQFDRLQHLSLFANEALHTSIIDVSGTQSLETILLFLNPILQQINGLEKQNRLKELSIASTGIRRIPDALRGKPLKRLDLSGLKLEELPDWLPELGLKFCEQLWDEGICLHGTTVKGVDTSIFEQSQEMILQWFESRKHADSVPLREVKVVFLGDGEAGKTHTIARLLNDGDAPQTEHFDDKATPGIVIKNKDYDLDGQKIQVHYWDFGGQEILHSMHRMFLTERTLYVVLINARDDTQDDRARYWLHNIKSFAIDAPVLLVLNKIDQNPNASINETELRDLYNGLRQVVRLSALEYSPEQFNRTLTDALMAQIRDLGTIGTRWPASWAKLKTGLQTMKDNFITGTQYTQMCRDSGVEKNREGLLHWFNDLGVSFFYQGSRRLEHYVILRPEWITNGIYTLLFNKSDDTKNGVIPKRVIYDMLDPEDEYTYRRVLNGVTYDVNETEYMLEVMRKFRLSYPVSNDEEFIPALCQRDSMPIAKTYAGDADALEFRMTYDYLPDNVIHRLMVEMRQDLQLSDVWRTGALFRQHGSGLSAVVKSEGDVLRIFVRSENPMHRPNTYLCILKENIDRINRDMKLAEPYAEVVYKTPLGSECFEYQDVLNALEDGEETYRSKKLRRRIPIQDILNQTGLGVELELQQLQEDILTACMQLQGNPLYWDSTEDQRNTFLRDALRSRKYLVNDQSFQGVGGGRKGYGELDLEIRRETDIPWTILEALRINVDSSKTEWNRHLKSCWIIIILAA